MINAEKARSQAEVAKKGIAEIAFRTVETKIMPMLEAKINEASQMGENEITCLITVEQKYAEATLNEVKNQLLANGFHSYVTHKQHITPLFRGDKTQYTLEVHW